MNILKYCSVTLFVLILSGCIPTITKVYQAPGVTGQVIELQSLQPLAGVNVAHAQNTAQFVTTDDNGQFLLSSISQTEFKMLMAGHALQQNMVTFYNQDNQIKRVVRSTLNSSVEETINLDTVIFDSQPNKIATPVKLSYQSIGLLKTYLSPKSLLASCNVDIGKFALSSLNTSRKLTEAASSKIEQTNSTAKRLRSLALNSYQQTAALWQELKSSCERTPANYKRIDSIFDSIEEETSVVVF